MDMDVCLYKWMCAKCTQRPERPGEGAGFPCTGLIDSCLHIDAGNKTLILCKKSPCS